MSPQTGVMGKVTFVHQPRVDAPRPRAVIRRTRLTIDFRRHGPALTAIAHARCMSAAALARSVVGDWLQAQSADSAQLAAMATEPDGSVPLQKDAPFAKVTLRMPADRVTQLARQARAVELSQGMYVAQLLDTQSDDPLDASPRELVATLVRSNAELAALNSGLKALARELEQTSSPELTGLDVLVAGLSAEVGQHLALAAPQLAALPASWRRPARNPD